MNERGSRNIIINILLSINTIFVISTLYLFYKNLMAEDMIRELNRDYGELAKLYDQERTRQGENVAMVYPQTNMKEEF